jgi:GNAT superfamily N-acetyltransferase
MTASEPTFRLARPEDTQALSALIAASARGLSRGVYSDAQVEAALDGTFGVDRDLIADGTYFLAEADGEPVACGGWSRRRALFGGDAYHGASQDKLDPATEPARIRAFFVHPDWARRGLGRRLLALSETAALTAGFRRMELMATLPGLPLYQGAGYVPREAVVFDLKGTPITFVPMGKTAGDQGF